MKTLLEIKKELVNPTKECWESLYKSLYSKLIIEWGYSDKVGPPNISVDGNFERNYIEFWISSVLQIPKNKLWDNIFKITSKLYEVSYHGSGKENSNITIDFSLLSKKEQLNGIPGFWIYENRKEVDEFMREDNIIYNRLNSIKENIFPIYDIF